MNPMPYKNIEKAKEYARLWYSKHKDYYKKKQQNYRAKNRERVCQHANEYRAKDRERWRAYARKRRLQIKLELFDLFDNKCQHCGFSDIRTLQVDHIHGRGLAHRKLIRTKSDTYYTAILIEIKAGSKDYQLLCANCNWIKKFENNEIREKDKKYV